MVGFADLTCDGRSLPLISLKGPRVEGVEGWVGILRYSKDLGLSDLKYLSPMGQLPFCMFRGTLPPLPRPQNVLNAFGGDLAYYKFFVLLHN